MTDRLHVDSLLKLHDTEFVEAVYQTLLGRPADPEGMRYYVTRVRAGFGKAHVILQVASSPEARNRGVHIDGLPELARQERRMKNWFWRILFRGSRLEWHTERIAVDINRLAHQLGELRLEASSRLAQLEHSMANLHLGGGVPTPAPAPRQDASKPSADTSHLTPRARQVLSRLQLPTQSPLEE